MSSDLPKHDERMLAIRTRDRNRCQNCHRTKDEVTRLEAHQIVPDHLGGAERLSNYTLLCDDCHGRVDNAIAQGAA